MSSYASRIGWSLVALFVAFSGQQAWVGSLTVPGANVMAILLVAGGLTGIWLVWSRQGELPVWTQLALLGAMVVGISYQASMTWIFDPSYGTDAVAFENPSISRSVGVEVSGFLGATTLRQLTITIDYRDGLVHFGYDAHRGYHTTSY